MKSELILKIRSTWTTGSTPQARAKAHTVQHSNSDLHSRLERDYNLISFRAGYDPQLITVNFLNYCLIDLRTWQVVSLVKVILNYCCSEIQTSEEFINYLDVTRLSCDVMMRLARRSSGAVSQHIFTITPQHVHWRSFSINKTFPTSCSTYLSPLDVLRHSDTKTKRKGRFWYSQRGKGSAPVLDAGFRGLKGDMETITANWTEGACKPFDFRRSLYRGYRLLVYMGKTWLQSSKLFFSTSVLGSVNKGNQTIFPWGKVSTSARWPSQKKILPVGK